MRRKQPETTKKVLEMFVNYKLANNGVPPTFREIMGSVAGVNSTSVVAHHIDKLVNQGLLIELDRGTGYDLAPQLGHYTVNWPAVQSALTVVE